MESSAGLLLLGEQVMSIVVQHLTTLDRWRLSISCRVLCRVCRKSVHRIRLAQQGLEQSDAFAVFPHAKHIHLHEPALDNELVMFLMSNNAAQLQQLTSIHITDPSYIDSSSIMVLLRACREMTSFHFRGDWQFSGDWQWDLAPARTQQVPNKLQSLSLQHNAHLTIEGLCSWLTAYSVPVDEQELPAGPPDTQSTQIVNNIEPGISLGSVGTTLEGNHTQQNQLELGGGHQHMTICPQASHLPASWPHLRKLDLSGCSKMGVDLLLLQLCPGLETLLLHSCSRVSNITLEYLHKEMQSCSSSQDGSTASSSHISTSNGALFATAAAGGAAPTPAVVDAQVPAAMQLSYLPLRHLDLAYTRVRDSGIKHLAAAMPQLQRLSVKGCNVSDYGLAHLLQLQQLTALNIKHCHRVTEEGIQHLSVLSGLQELSFGYTSLPAADEIAATIAAQFSQLTGMNLLCSELTDEGLASLGGLRILRQLHLYQAGVSCSGLELFAQQPGGQQLQNLVLYGCGKLTTLEGLGTFSCLQNLQLGCLCDLEDVPTAIQQLTAAQHLTSLVLERIDGITMRALQHVLRGCRNLSKLRVRGCDGLSQDDMERLAAHAAELCRSSASLYWAGSSMPDTDDEEGGDRLLFE